MVEYTNPPHNNHSYGKRYCKCILLRNVCFFQQNATVMESAGTAGKSSRPEVSTPVSYNAKTRCTDVDDVNKHNYAVTASPRALKRTINQLFDKLDDCKSELKRVKKNIYRLKTKVICVCNDTAVLLHQGL